MKDSFPCKCGHLKKDHQYRSWYKTSGCASLSLDLLHICWKCIELRYDPDIKDQKEYKPYHKFQPDNLKYLENKSK